MCGANCTCTAGECGDPNCPTVVRSGYSTLPTGEAAPGDWLMYKIGYNKALNANKPLLVWVGETCVSCESQWTQYVHCRVSMFDSSITQNPITNPYTGPGVLVMKPDGNGGMTIVGKLEGIPALSSVQADLQGVQQTQQVQQAFQPVFRPMPTMMPMMGGFCGGGGCAGGG